ncbi:MAG: hypothetical protein ACJATW_001700 [Glaciecola sp.]|jgi:hypothetical protein
MLCSCHDIPDGERIVYGDSQKHFMEGLAYCHFTTPIVPKAVGFGVSHVGLNIPEAVLAFEASVINRPCMDMSSRGWFGQRHSKNLN